jgi:DNA polymerase III sliding clamp (beta) subunit (PCNA family)
MLLPLKETRAALPLLSRAIGKRIPIPILACVHLRQDFHGIHLTTTDLEIFLTATIFNPAAAALPPRVRDLRAKTYPVIEACIELANLKSAAAAAEEDIVLSLATNAIICKTKSGDILMPIALMDIKEFPHFNPAIGPLPISPWHTENLGSILADALHFVSSDESRYVLNGVSWDNEYIASTDGRRLFAHPTTDFHKAKEAIVIPTEAAKIIATSKDSGVVFSVYGSDANFPDQSPSTFSAEWVHPKLSSLTVRTCGKLISGRYPNYRMIFPHPNDYTAEIRVDADDLSAKLKGMIPLIDQGLMAVEFWLDWEKRILRLVARARDAAEPITSSITFVCRSHNHKAPLKTAFNPHYLIDALKTGFTTIHFIEEKSPIVLKSWEDRTAIIMPMRVQPPPSDQAPPSDPSTKSKKPTPVPA